MEFGLRRLLIPPERLLPGIHPPLQVSGNFLEPPLPLQRLWLCPFRQLCKILMANSLMCRCNPRASIQRVYLAVVVELGCAWSMVITSYIIHLRAEYCRLASPLQRAQSSSLTLVLKEVSAAVKGLACGFQICLVTDVNQVFTPITKHCRRQVQDC